MENNHVKENGNIVFHYNRKRYRDKKNYFVLLVVALIGAFVLSIYLFPDSVRTALLFFFFLGLFPLFIVFAIILSNVNVANQKIEEDIVFQNLNDIIGKDISSFGNEVYELKREYAKPNNGKKIVGTALVLLSSGTELLYSVSHITESDEVVVLEIDVKYKIKDQIQYQYE
ncbi:MAG: hypothetical protein FWC10_08485 [Lentimicrobiaceae bacterium]|nr:hypothetical protein [Lentimicrobiaceae bacterium]